MNLYSITIERLEKDSDLQDIIVTRTHNVEANDYFSAIDMLKELYFKFENVSVIDIIKVERIAKDIIHTNKK